MLICNVHAYRMCIYSNCVASLCLRAAMALPPSDKEAAESASTPRTPPPEEESMLDDAVVSCICTYIDWYVHNSMCMRKIYMYMYMCVRGMYMYVQVATIISVHSRVS